MSAWLEQLTHAGASPIEVLAAVARSSEGGLVVHAIACAIVGLLVRCVPALRGRVALTVLALAASTVAYGRAMPGFLLTAVVSYAALVAVTRVAKHSANERVVRWRLACVAIAILSAAFLVGRAVGLGEASVAIGGTRWALFALDMWLVLRLVTLAWEVGSRRIERPTPGEFALWYALPFTAIGPVLRYSAFRSMLDRMQDRSAGDAVVTVAWGRALALAAAHLVAGILLIQLQSTFPTGPGKPRWVNLAVWFGTAPWSFFLVWAGFFRLMEVLGRLWRVELPPSFDAPFGRPNISDFWANWNMTATAVFRDYLFYNRWGFRRANAYVNTMILFVTVGLWHGANAYWVLWGALHGVGFCAYLVYKRRRAADATRVGMPTPLAAALTYVFVCSCWAVPSVVLKLVGALAP